jgi:hypothetical protein
MEVTLNSLTDQLSAAATDVSNVTNQFLCLSNTQFLENRVYDDDNDDDKEMPQEEKKEEVKVRGVMYTISGSLTPAVPLAVRGGSVGGAGKS